MQSPIVTNTKEQNEQKNNTLQFYRLIFTLIICLHHFQYVANINFLKHGYICVEFFFILSEFLLASSFYKETTHSCGKYIIKRIKRLYPEYFLATIISIGILGIAKNEFILEKAIAELLMMQNIGVFSGGGYNYPCWYISVLMFISIVIYGFLSVYSDFFIKILALPIVILGYTFIFSNEQGIENWGTVGFCYMPLLRGFCGLTMGVLAERITANVAFEKINSVCGTAVEVFCLGFILSGLVRENNIDMYIILAFEVLIIFTVKETGYLSKKVFNHTCFNKWAKINYAMYLNHAVIVTIFAVAVKYSFQTTNGVILLIMYYLILVAYSIFTNKFIEKGVLPCKQK